MYPVNHWRIRNSSSAFTACNNRLVYMMAGWIQVKDLAVERVRKPGQRMPVGLLKRSERP